MTKEKETEISEKHKIIIKNKNDLKITNEVLNKIKQKKYMISNLTINENHIEINLKPITKINYQKGDIVKDTTGTLKGKFKVIGIKEEKEIIGIKSLVDSSEFSVHPNWIKKI